jgi:hypothetical protein
MKNYTKKYLTLGYVCYMHLTKDMEHVNLCGILWDIYLYIKLFCSKILYLEIIYWKQINLWHWQQSVFKQT